MDKITITMPEQMGLYVRARIQSGSYGNISEYFRDLIRREQAERLESQSEIQAVQAKLIEAEASGFTDQSIDDIWEQARLTANPVHGKL